MTLQEIIQELRSMSASMQETRQLVHNLAIDPPTTHDYIEELQPIIESLEQLVGIEQVLENIKVIAIQAMTGPSPNALTWDCFVRIRNAVDQTQARNNLT